MITYRLFLAAAISSMVVNADTSEDGRCMNFGPANNTIPIKEEDFEDFQDYKDEKDYQEIIKTVKGLQAEHSDALKTPELIRAWRCDPRREADAIVIRQCTIPDGKCVREKVRTTNEEVENGETAKYQWKPFCLRPCSRVCTRRWLRCGGLAEDPPSYPIAWHNAEQQRCYQIEKSQLGVYFLRTKCKCPIRDYTVSDGCDTTGATASLSNCIQGYLSQNSEINFHDVSNVQLGYVKSTSGDIDFQGFITRSMFCRIDSAEDVEYGGGDSSCAAKLTNNFFFNTDVTDDLQFEEGTTLKNNFFFDVQASDDFKFQSDISGAFTTTISNNYFRTVYVHDKCRIDTDTPPQNLIIFNNYCNTFTENGGTFCSANFGSPKFSCL